MLTLRRGPLSHHAEILLLRRGPFSILLLRAVAHSPVQVPEGWIEWGRMRYGDDCLSQLLNATLRVRNGIASIGTKSQRLDALSSLPHNARVVHITRRNTLKWCVSRLPADQTPNP